MVFTAFADSQNFPTVLSNYFFCEGSFIEVSYIHFARYRVLKIANPFSDYVLNLNTD